MKNYRVLHICFPSSTSLSGIKIVRLTDTVFLLCFEIVVSRRMFRVFASELVATIPQLFKVNNDFFSLGTENLKCKLRTCLKSGDYLFPCDTISISRIQS